MQVQKNWFKDFYLQTRSFQRSWALVCMWRNLASFGESRDFCEMKRVIETSCRDTFDNVTLNNAVTTHLKKWMKSSSLEMLRSKETLDTCIELLKQNKLSIGPLQH